MAIMVTRGLISFADDGGDYCGNGVLQEILAFLHHHGGGGGRGGNGDPLVRVKLSQEARGELEKLSRTLIETANRFEQVAARAVKEHQAVGV
jgi:hypothetical protein